MDWKQVERIYVAKSEDDPMLFIRGLKIPSAHGPVRFQSCATQFQLDCFADLAPSLIAVRNGTMPPVRRFWIERTKKAGKDSDLAACLLWLLAFPRRPTYFQVGAADKDQAAIVRRRIEDLVYYNPWLKTLVEVRQYTVKNKSGLASLDILAADVSGSHGETPHLLVCNELSHVRRWEFIQNLLDNADGVPMGVEIIATNAGIRGTPPEKMRRDAESNPGVWRMHVWDRPAPWISQQDLEEAKRRNPPGRYKRLWWGQWVSGTGDALDEGVIDKVFRKELLTVNQCRPGWLYIAGLDLGVTHDHSALVVVGLDVPGQRIQVAQIRSWEPGKNGQVDLQAVEDACYAATRNFQLSWLGYDPTEARLMAQRLTRRGVPMREVSFSKHSNLTAMATALIQVVDAGKLECFEDERLRRDFGKFHIVERGNGYKLESVSDEHGHADVGTALVITLPRAVAMLAGRMGLCADDVVADHDADPLTEEEIEELPDGLRDIYEAYDLEEQEARMRKVHKEDF